MDMTSVIAIHLSAAPGATVLGPLAIRARCAAMQRPRPHRASGYAWVTLLLLTALSVIFNRDFRLPNIAGYTESVYSALG